MHTKTLILAAAVLTAVPATAAAEERTCRGALGTVKVDNLRVPDGAACTLNGTRVEGTVKVESGAVLRATAIKVKGNVQAENHRSVTIKGRRTRIDGSVQIKQGGGLTLTRTFVGADVQVLTNRGTIAINRNSIDGNLQCKENVPAPTGAGNDVQGNQEDQCARL